MTWLGDSVLLHAMPCSKLRLRLCRAHVGFGYLLPFVSYILGSVCAIDGNAASFRYPSCTAAIHKPEKKSKQKFQCGQCSVVDPQTQQKRALQTRQIELTIRDFRFFCCSLCWPDRCFAFVSARPRCLRVCVPFFLPVRKVACCYSFACVSRR